jgi:hypothetical protein
MEWRGVIPAIVTPFRDDLSVDADLLRLELDALVAAGCPGVVALGSLGEGGSLSYGEKKALLRLCRETLGAPPPSPPRRRSASPSSERRRGATASWSCRRTSIEGTGARPAPTSRP